jgi:succinate dehydrogenase/fumarate reductase flavoprotein subunit
VTRANDETFDLVVLGSGVGGLTAALVAALRGLRPVVLESSDRIGGTSALSSGTVWIPDNPAQRSLGTADDGMTARTYLDALVGDRADSALREAFLAAGPHMLDELAREADIRFRLLANSPDYRQDLPGAAEGGRPLEPEPFDGRLLGRDFDRLRWPIPELMLFGGMMVTRTEAARLVRSYRSLDGMLLGTRLVSRYLGDRLRHRRGTRLVLGNALVARLTRALRDRDVDIWTETRTSRLLQRNGRVEGLVARGRDGERTIIATRGAVLAGGGFPASPELRARYLPEPVAQYTAACGSCVGDTLALAQAVGATLGEPGLDNALWFPSSVATREDATTAVYPHIALDRSKPGLVAVNAAGRRFVDEAVSYHEFTRAMYRSHRSVPSIPAVLVCDRRFVWKYGLGLIRPLAPSLRSFVARGYLFMADSIDALARSVGVDAQGLAQTVAMNNVDARTGIDTVFGKGGNAYDRYNGDAAHRPNPCLGPIDKPPFCAVKVYPTPLGTSLGLRTDLHARVLDASGGAIPGLYACGNDMHSVFGGEYPGPGAQLGLAMTFGWVAASHAADVEFTERRAAV